MSYDESKPLIEVDNLEYIYDNGKHALNGINLKVKKGEKIAVIGRNGAGKSTFFLNLNGVLTPHAGEIRFMGKPIGKKQKELNELRKHVGIVFQDADNQIIATTVQAEVSFGPMNMKLSKEEVQRRVDEALADMNISDFKDRPPHYLSGGEKKRVSIADIIAMKPEVIIFDEPTAALDPLNAQMLEEALTKLENQNMTLLISTHDVDFAYRWAERAVVFCGGKIIADGTPLEVFKNDEVVKMANLKRPMMLDVYEEMVKHGLVEDNGAYPKTVTQFQEMLSQK
ncbi:ATPase component CbiO of energizing module of cobalt ECF transporter [Lachnospiraceae bacterium TWA4]|nr:ATPase component CbiO of energizing module of cobalt ECF transporter [Lachnospiraceae bacterium TWA4]